VSITVAHGKLKLAMALGGAGETLRRTFYTLVDLATTHHRAAVAIEFLPKQ
jgi:flavoprotein